MPRETWTVRIELCQTEDSVYANAILVDGPALLTGHGRAAVEDPDRVAQCRALAARRAMTDLGQAMRSGLERGRPVHIARP